MTESQECPEIAKSYRRVKLSPEINQQIESIAKRYNCMYGDKPNLSELLQQIGDGRLNVVRQSLSAISPHPLIELEIEVLSDMNGILAEISGRIAKCRGNIYQAKADQHRFHRSIKVAVFIPDTTNLPRLIKDLREITFEDLQKFNTHKQQLQVLKTIAPEEARPYEILSKREGEHKMEEFFRNVSPDHKSRRMIVNISFVIGFQVTLDNQPGVLSALSHQISEKYISIRSISIITNPDQQSNLAEIYLGFNSETVASFDSIENIRKFIKGLKTLPFIRNVTQFSIAYSDGYE
jgi:predicted regulator of amino acid metabolism with ACT domain